MSLIVARNFSEQNLQSATDVLPLCIEVPSSSPTYWSMMHGGEDDRDGGLRAWARRRGGRLLVVDDSPVERAVTASLLERSGFRVILATGGREAVEILRTSPLPFDAVVMDVAMPGMDGLTATRKIRGLSGGRGHVPIIALTANTGDQDRVDCLAAGMNAHTCKPLSLATLLGAMRDHLPAAQGLR